jgi:hypothetical protein
MTSLDDIVKGLHGLFDRGVPVEAVTLEDIDVVELQAFETVLNRVEDVL